MDKLKFGKGNAKLDKRVVTFSIPAGKTCPGANECKSMAVEKDGKRTIKDGPETKFRCFAASQEVLYTNTFNARAHNLALLKKALRQKCPVMKASKLILDSLSKKADYLRTHVSGDFFSENYFKAWLKVADLRPNTLFYAYTKSLHFWVKNFDRIPDNFVLTASVGGKHDHLIDQYNLRSARVVYSEAEAKALGLEIDHDDSLAMKHGDSFALLLHGAQPKGSVASKALSELKKVGKGGYSAGRKVKAKLPVLSA